MNHSGDAAEQIVRMSLEGVEIAAKITGTAAKEIAVLLIAALKSDNKHLKTKGRARLTAMLNSGKPLEIFSVKESDLKTFTRQAKEYGVVYCALRNTKASPDGMCDILVKADDAPKINRIVERFKFATVDKAKIESEIVAEIEGRSAPLLPTDSEFEMPVISDTDKLLNELFGPVAEKPVPSIDSLALFWDKISPDGQVEPDNPEAVQTETHVVEVTEVSEESRPLADSGAPPPTSPLSESIFESKSSSAEASGKTPWLHSTKPSVREELREIKAARREQEKSPDAPAPDKPKDKPQPITHKQPKGKRIKSKKGKYER